MTYEPFFDVCNLTPVVRKERSLEEAWAQACHLVGVSVRFRLFFQISVGAGFFFSFEKV